MVGEVRRELCPFDENPRNISSRCLNVNLYDADNLGVWHDTRRRYADIKLWEEQILWKVRFWWELEQILSTGSNSITIVWQNDLEAPIQPSDLQRQPQEFYVWCCYGPVRKLWSPKHVGSWCSLLLLLAVTVPVNPSCLLLPTVRAAVMTLCWVWDSQPTTSLQSNAVLSRCFFFSLVPVGGAAIVADYSIVIEVIRGPAWLAVI